MKIFKIMFFDIKQYVKSFAIIILLIAPYFLIIIASGYSIMSEEKSYRFAVLEDTDQNITQKLNKCGEVFIHNSEEDIIKAVEDENDMIGIYNDTIVLSENTPKYIENYTKLIIKSQGQTTEINVEDMGVKSTIYKYGIISFLINISVLISGLIYGLSLLRERLNGTYLELRSFGINDISFYISKLMIPSVVLLINVWAILNEFKLQDINKVLVYIFCIINIPLIITIGTALFNIPQNQSKSFITLVVIIVVFIVSTALIVYTNFDFLIFILPFYWCFFVIYNILGDSISLQKFCIYSIAFIGMNIAYIRVMKNLLLIKK